MSRCWTFVANFNSQILTVQLPSLPPSPLSHSPPLKSATAVKESLYFISFPSTQPCKGDWIHMCIMLRGGFTGNMGTESSAIIQTPALTFNGKDRNLWSLAAALLHSNRIKVHSHRAFVWFFRN